jgi:hypothetical protein
MVGTALRLGRIAPLPARDFRLILGENGRLLILRARPGGGETMYRLDGVGIWHSGSVFSGGNSVYTGVHNN